MPEISRFYGIVIKMQVRRDYAAWNAVSTRAALL